MAAVGLGMDAEAVPVADFGRLAAEYDALVASLEGEVEALRAAVDRDGGAEPAGAEDVEEQSSELAALAGVAGVEITAAESTVEGGRRRYHLRGLGRGLGFAMRFAVDEADALGKVDGLEIDVDPPAADALAPLVAAAQARGSLRLFFKGLADYARLAARRRAAFATLRQRHPRRVLLPGTETAHLVARSGQAGAVVRWALRFDAKGALSQCVEFIPQHKGAVALPTGLCGAVAGAYADLLKLKGFTAATEIMLDAVAS